MKSIFKNRYIRHLRLFFKEVYKDDLMFYASSLSFYTIFTVIPFIFVILSIFTFTDYFSEQYELVKLFLLENLVPAHSSQVTEHIDSFISNSLKLGYISSFMIFISSLLFFQNFEYVVNKIFKTKQKNFIKSLVSYILFLITIPISFTLVFYLSYLMNKVIRMSEYLYWFDAVKIVPYLIIWWLFFFVYKVSINIKLNHKLLLVSTFLNAFVWVTAKNLFIQYVVYNETYSTIYGQISILFFFFLWIYFSWILFIYGLKITYIFNKIRFKKSK